LWGVPIPIFYCAGCGEPLLTPDVGEHLAAQVRRQGADVWFEREAAELLPPGRQCPKCGGGEFRKETDILDVWFDSGTSHQTVLTQRDDQKYPAELYLEGSDQHRGWFQSSMLTAVGLTGSPPFKTVITTGWTLDEQREKESKSKGNITNPLDIIDTYGADLLRLWVSSVDYTADMVVGESVFIQMTDAYRKIRNTFRFMLGNLSDSDEESDSVCLEDMTEIDRWALSRTQALLDEVTEAFERFEFYRAYHRIYNFCTVDLSAFYLDILKDRLYTYGPTSRERRSSQTAFARILRLLDLMLAPVLAFTSEELWAKIRRKGDPLSVHLAPWPELDEAIRDRDLEERWQRLQSVRSEIAKVIEGKRETGEMGNSLEARVSLFTRDEEMLDFLKGFGGNLKAVFIVSSVDVIDANRESVPEGAIPSAIEGLSIAVSQAEGQKCKRCWKYTPTVGQSSHHPEICGDCVAVLVNFFGEHHSE